MTKSIVSYNVNGIRAAMRKGLTDWLLQNQFDIIGFQETKAHRDQVEMDELEKSGYHHYWHSAEKKGYSGVSIVSKNEADNVIEGMGIERFDKEGRVLRADFGDLTVLNCYFPSGTSGEERQAVKFDFLDTFSNWIKKLKKERPNLIIMGDYNIAHTEMDIHNPKTNKKSSGFLPEEREWMTKWFAEGMTDSFRYLNPDLQKYSWWTYRANARNNNKGWRIDYVSVSDNLKDKLEKAELLNDVVHSDHCPCLIRIKD